MERLQYRESYLRQLIAIAVVIGSVLLTMALTSAMADGFNSVTIFLLLAGLGLPLGITAIMHWRLAFYIVIFLIVFEGIPRNLSNQVGVLLVKDVLLGFTYLGYFREYRFTTFLKPKLRILSTLLLVISSYSLAEMINPSLTSPLIGLIGIKTLLFYMPLVYLGYELITDGSKLVKFVVFVMVLTNLSCLLGIYQYIGGYAVIKFFQPVQIFSSLGGLGEYYKFPGSFAAAGNFAGFLQISFALSLGMLYCQGSRRLRAFSLLTAANCSLVSVLMGQRSNWIFILLCLILGSIALSGNNKARLARLGIAGLLVFGFFLAISSTDNIIGDRFSQFSSGTGFQQYLVDAPTGSVANQLSRLTTGGTVFGRGIGMASPGARYFNTDREFIEAYTADLIFELGFPGLILVFGMLFYLIWLACQALYAVTDLRYNNIIYYGLIVMVYLIIGSITYAPLTVPPNGQFFWLLPGMFIGLQSRVTQQVSLKELLLRKVSNNPRTYRELPLNSTGVPPGNFPLS